MNEERQEMQRRLNVAMGLDPEYRGEPGELECRNLPGGELRAATENGQMVVSGYGMRWNTMSLPLPYREQFIRGSVTASVEKGDLRFLREHDGSKLLGRASAGTITTAEDATGLRFRCVLPPTALGQDTFEAVKRKDLTQMSFAFRCLQDQWTKIVDPDSGQENDLRTVTLADLRELFAVSWAAYASDENISVADRNLRLWPSGLLPESFPAELRSRIGAPRPAQPTPISDAEWLLRARAKLRAQQVLMD